MTKEGEGKQVTFIKKGDCMLSQKLLDKEKIMEICKKDHTIFKKGMVFNCIKVLNPDLCSSMLTPPVTFCGYTDKYELLFSSGNGQYYFSLCDGWGVQDGCLYALSIGEIRRDYKKPVTVDEIEYEANNPKEPKSTYGALSIRAKNKCDQKILKVLKSR